MRWASLIVCLVLWQVATCAPGRRQIVRSRSSGPNRCDDDGRITNNHEKKWSWKFWRCMVPCFGVGFECHMCRVDGDDVSRSMQRLNSVPGASRSRKSYKRLASLNSFIIDTFAPQRASSSSISDIDSPATKPKIFDLSATSSGQGALPGLRELLAMPNMHASVPTRQIGPPYDNYGVLPDTQATLGRMAELKHSNSMRRKEEARQREAAKRN